MQGKKNEIESTILKLASYFKRQPDIIGDNEKSKTREMLD